MANTVFKLRRSSVAGKVPNTSTLAIGELALNLTDRKLFSSDGSNVWETGANLTNLVVSSNATVNNLILTRIYANSSAGVNGQVLASNGSSTYWFTPIGGVIPLRQQYTGDGTTTSFTVTGGYVANSISVFVNGVLLRNGTEVDVTSGSTFTITPAPSNGALIDVVGPSQLYSTGVNTIVSQQFTANGTANSFAVTGGYIANSVLVFLNGVKQIPGTDVDITSGANVGFYSTPSNGFIVDVYGYQTMVSLGANTITVGSNLTIGTDSITIGNSSVNTVINTVSASFGSNVNIVGAGRVISGDFSSGIANRVVIRTSNTDLGTSLSVLPNGTGVGSGFSAFSTSLGTNSSAISIGSNTVEGTIATFNNGSSSTLPIAFRPALRATPSLYLATDGKVGIGTNSPTSYLDVVGDNQYIQQRTSTSAGVSSVWAMDNDFWSTPTYRGIAIQHYAATSNITLLGSISSNNAGVLIFQNEATGIIYTNGGTPLIIGTTNAERMRIAANGNIGIGTSTPDVKLRITGNNVAAKGQLVLDSQDYSQITHYNGSTHYATWYTHTSGNLGGSFFGTVGAAPLYFQTNGTAKVAIESAGHMVPIADNAYNLGSGSARWANIYTGDLNLSNEGSGGNDIDGTTGSWTIQEGENDLYIINKKNGKKFKIKLEEIV